MVAERSDTSRRTVVAGYRPTLVRGPRTAGGRSRPGLAWAGLATAARSADLASVRDSRTRRIVPGGAGCRMAQSERCGIAQTASTRWAMDPAAAAISNDDPAPASSRLTRASIPTATLGRKVTPVRSRTSEPVSWSLCRLMADWTATTCSSLSSPVTVSTWEVASNSMAVGTSDTVGRYPNEDGPSGRTPDEETA